jgi:hypothetical protein
MTSSHSEIDRLLAEADDMIAFGVTIGIDPDDDSDAAQRRLAFAWEHHCAQVARNERGSQLADEVFLDSGVKDSEALAIFNFVQDIVLRLKDEESKETLISSVLLMGLEHVSGPLADRVDKWIQEGK